MNPPCQRTSDLLALLAERMKVQDSLTLQDVIGMLKERVFGLSIVLFCVPNCLPIPNVAGLSALTGIPIGIVGLEMAAGRPHLWLPRALRERRLPGRRMAGLIEQAVPGIRKLETLLHPRFAGMSGAPAQRLLGLAFVALATVLSLPIPFGNMLPGWAMALIAIGLMERDGLLILAGLAVGAATLALLFALGDTLFSFFRSLLA